MYHYNGISSMIKEQEYKSKVDNLLTDLIFNLNMAVQWEEIANDEMALEREPSIYVELKEVVDKFLDEEDE